MAKNLNYQISLRLTAKQFQRELKRAQNSLKRFFKSSAFKIGAMFGFGNLGQEAIDVAKNLDKADSVLKNVSASSEALAQNQEYLSRIAKKYNQDLIVLTNNYAKYHATANQAGVSLQEQQYIYESLVRAAAHFNLSADDTNGIMLAVTQMMSKGKVSAEELRQQLGERLPGAMGLMAKGLGISIQELDTMMRQGKLLATDALPALAKAMNESFGSFDTDSITANTNKLKNAFTNLVKKSGADRMWNGIVKGSTKAVEFIADNFKSLKTVILALIAGITGGKIWGGLSKSYQAEIDKIKSINSKARSEIMQLVPIMDKQRIAFKEHSRKYFERKLVNGSFTPVPKSWLSPEDRDKVIAESMRLNKELEKTKKKIHDIKTNTMQATSAWGYLGTKIKMVGRMMKGYLISMIPTAIMSAVAFLVGKFVEIQKAATKFRKELQTIIKVSDEGKEKAKATESPEDAILDALAQQYEKVQNELSALPEGSDAWNKKMKESEALLKSINNYLGKEGDAVLKVGDDWKKAIAEKKEYYARKREYDEAVRQNVEAKSKRDEYQKTIKDENLVAEVMGAKTEADLAKGNAAMDAAINYNNLKGKLDLLQKGIKDQTKVIDDNNKIISDFEIDYPQSNDMTDMGGGSDTGEQTSYGEIQEEYFKELNILERKLEDGVLSQEEFNSATRELARKTLDSLYSLDGFKVGSDDFSKALIKASENIQIDPVQEQIRQAVDNYNSKLKELNNQRDAELITENQYNDSLRDLTEETIMALAAMGAFADGVSDFEQNLLDAFNTEREKQSDKVWEEYQKNYKGKNYDRDTTFDYKMSDSDIMEENLDNTQRKVEDLQSAIEYLNSNMDILFAGRKNEAVNELEKLGEELTKAKDNAKNLEDAIRFQEVTDDVRAFEKELKEATIDSIETVAGSFRTLAESIRNLGEILNDSESTGFEKFISMIDIIGQMINGISQSIKVFEQLNEATMAVQASTQAMEATQDSAMAKSIARAGTEVAANQAVTMSKGASSAASLPFPYNIAAIATTIAAIAAMFATLPKFSNGGLVPGTSTSGDRTLARVNSGELILNKGQQATLFSILNGSGTAGRNNGNVKFEISGDKLIGVLRNHGRKFNN